MTDRLEIATTMMVALLREELRTPPKVMGHLNREDAERLAGDAICLADALIEADKVPAPSSGLVAPPPGSDSPSIGAGSSTSGAASPQAVEDAAAQIVTPGDLASPSSAPAGTNPVRPPSRKAKGTACGGLLCRESQTKLTHDAATCPQYAGRKTA